MQGLLDIWDDWRKKTYQYGGSLQQKYGGSSLTDFGSAVARENIPGMETVHQSFQQSGEQGKTPLGATSDFLRKSPAMNRVHGVAQNVGEKGLVPSLKQAGGIVQAIENYGASLYKGGDPTVANFISDVAKDAQKKAHPIIKSSQTKIKKMIDKLPAGDLDTKFAKQEAGKTPKKGIPFHPSQGGNNQNLAGDQDKLDWLGKLTGTNMDKAMATWKEKGGFEGLMANPAFTMGLAFMQAGAEGKSIGQGALDNVMKAAGISSHYKKILKDREEAPIEVTATDIGEIKSLLGSMNISDPSNIEKFFGKITGKGNVQLKFDLAAEEIAVELQKEIKKLKKNKKPGSPEVVYDTKMKMKILKRMLNEGKFKKKGGTWFTDATLETTQEIPMMAEGGPVEAGKPYIVGEEGPEIVIPHSDGNVLSNDDSQIYAMLLASNPQLQKVSRTRAEKILRSRFPEYFE